MKVIPMYEKRKSNKNFLATLALSFFLGALGVHRFYVGKIWTGIFMLLTIGGFGIWSLIDIIRIILGNFKDANGLVIKN